MPDQTEIRDKILDTIRDLENLPTLPVVVDLLNRELKSARASATSIAKIIEDDPSIMARVLKLVNSPLYAPTFKSRKGVTIQQAVVRLGTNALRNLVLSTTVMTMFPSKTNPSFDRTEFWRHSICVGFVAKILAEFCPEGLLPYEESDLALAGLCHDIGKIVLDQYFNEFFQDVMSEASSKRVLIWEAERSLLKTDHGEVGFALAERWKLPEHIAVVMKYHHAPSKIAGRQHEILVHAVTLADYICNHQNLGYSGNCRIMEFPAESFEMLKLDVEVIPDILLRVHQEAEKSDILLSISGHTRVAVRA